MSPNPELLVGLGVAFSIFLTAAGTCIASVPAGIYLQHSTDRLLAFVPITQAGVLAVYGIIIGVILSYKFEKDISDPVGYKSLAAGLSVGLACLMSGIGMANFLERFMYGPSRRSTETETAESEPLIAARSNLQQLSLTSTPRFIMALIYLEAVGLYGLIVALLLSA